MEHTDKQVTVELNSSATQLIIKTLTDRIEDYEEKSECDGDYIDHLVKQLADERKKVEFAEGARNEAEKAFEELFKVTAEQKKVIEKTADMMIRAADTIDAQNHEISMLRTKLIAISAAL